jgi:hypothetical protein
MFFSLGSAKYLNIFYSLIYHLSQVRIKSVFQVSARKSSSVLPASPQAEPELPVGLDPDGPRVHGAQEHKRRYRLLQKSN